MFITCIADISKNITYSNVSVTLEKIFEKKNF